uniref:Dolichyl-diphosphooligosaccharide--protein glycosyltransferase subunit 1 n=1 Tax=Compsopogon caeruleus TaxID=31354 RepID=A0A7S1TBE9_9RHOD
MTGKGRDWLEMRESGPGDEAQEEYVARLTRPIAPGESVTLDIEETLFGAMKPVPSAIREGEDQYMAFLDSFYFYSPYQTVDMKTEITLPMSKVTKISDQVQPASQSGKVITLGPYSNVPPRSFEVFHVRFMQPHAIVSARQLHKHFWVSQWGKIRVLEEYVVANVGPKVNYEVRRLGESKPTFDGVTAHLPKQASDVFYRDDVGNITTSNLRRPGKGHRVLEMKFRFPLYGGWKIAFSYGYNLPLVNFLEQITGKQRYRVKLNFEPSIVDDMDVENYALSVTLPEGSSDIVMDLPRGLILNSKDKRLTFPTLSYVGSPTLQYETKYIRARSAEHPYLYIQYTYPRWNLFRAPIALIIVFMAMFAIALGYGRLEQLLRLQKTMSQPLQTDDFKKKN